GPPVLVRGQKGTAPQPRPTPDQVLATLIVRHMGRTERVRNQNKIIAVAFSPDGRRLLTQGVDPAVRLWDTATGQPKQPSPYLSLLRGDNPASNYFLGVTPELRRHPNRPSSPMQDSNIATHSGPGQVDPKKLKNLAEIWGRLPERERQVRLQGLSRDLPPRYREVIQEYFRKVSEQSGERAPLTIPPLITPP